MRNGTVSGHFKRGIGTFIRGSGSRSGDVYGSPTRLMEIEGIAFERGWRTRRTGTSVAILHANGDSGGLDGERRVTNLEDVFVLLTGEEIA